MTEEELQSKMAEAKENGLGIEQVALALKEKFKDREDVFIVVGEPFSESENPLTGNEESDLGIIKFACDIYKQNPEIKFICAPYGGVASGVPHMRSLVLVDSEHLIASDSFPRDRSFYEEHAANLASKFEIDKEKIVRGSELGGLMFQSDEWECGVHSYLKTIELVELFDRVGTFSGSDIRSISSRNPDRELDGENLNAPLREILINHDRQINPTPATSVSHPELSEGFENGRKRSFDEGKSF